MGMSLTPREEQILAQLRLGLPLKVIALELGVHPSTVSTHVSSAARKLGAHNRVELARKDRPTSFTEAFEDRSLPKEAPSGVLPKEVSAAINLDTESDPFEMLSPAEREVARLAREGRSNAEIACARGTSPRTVANQLARIYKKLGVGSRVALAIAS